MKRILVCCLTVGLLGSLSASNAFALDLNQAEKDACLKKFWLISYCGTAYVASKNAEKETNRQFANVADPQADGVPSNAFKHCYWNALMTISFRSKKLAKAFGDLHEDFSDNKPANKKMDLYNNKKGRKWAYKVMKKWPVKMWNSRVIYRCKKNTRPGGKLIRYRGYEPGLGPDISSRR